MSSVSCCNPGFLLQWAMRRCWPVLFACPSVCSETKLRSVRITGNSALPVQERHLALCILKMTVCHKRDWASGNYVPFLWKYSSLRSVTRWPLCPWWTAWARRCDTRRAASSPSSTWWIWRSWRKSLWGTPAKKSPSLSRFQHAPQTSSLHFHATFCILRADDCSLLMIAWSFSFQHKNKVFFFVSKHRSIQTSLYFSTLNATGCISKPSSPNTNLDPSSVNSKKRCTCSPMNLKAQ